MLPSEDSFLFDSLASKSPKTTRKDHIRRLYDILQLCIHRSDLPRARRAWAILARCKEIKWTTLWSTAVYLVGDSHSRGEDVPKQLAFLRELMLHIGSEREVILQEMIFRLIILERYQDALDELELYLPSFPYQDNPVLHTYAGLLCLYLSQSSEDEQEPPRINESTLREARSHLERAMALDPENMVASSFLGKISILRNPKAQTTQDGDNQDSDDDFHMNIEDDTGTPKRKRIRITDNTREDI